jgi:hypothetical protein
VVAPAICMHLHRAAIYIRFVGPLRFLWCNRCRAMR